MAWPQFRPMPVTKHMPYEQGAMLRANHRRLMMMRWRNPELRAEDRKLKQLPQDWHDWMMCDALDGYGTQHCSCDTWMDRMAAVARNKPRSMMQRELALRVQLDQLSTGQRVRPRVVQEIAEAAVWVKTLDTSDFPPTLSAHELSPENVDLAADLPAAASEVRHQGGGRYWPGRQANARHHGVGLREPPWAIAASTHMSALRARGRQDR